jgi:hypothetical protein
MLKYGEVNPLNVFGLRRLDHCPPHFTKIHFDLRTSFKDITDWVFENLEGRFYANDSFSEDITVSVLKIVKLFQNKRFSKDEAVEKLTQVERIVMSEAPQGELEDIIEILQLPKAALFAACRKYFSGNFEKDIKALVKNGRSLIDKDMGQALDIAAQIGANVIDGVSCCGKYLKDDLDQPTLFDEWLIECERINEAMTSLKNFDETTGEEI